ncbi:MAG: hypothetical protein LCH77_03010 [Actinobacteria bacterium]|nr:hypothetical protein [Actinomycetota bacterium]
MTTWAVLVPLLSALLGAFAGGLVAHLLTRRREQENARRAQRVAYLVEAYRRLIACANRRAMTVEQEAALEAALSDVMLLGGADEVERAREFMAAMAQGRGADLEPLIEALRVSLREEIGLAEVPLPRPYNLRIERGGGTVSQPTSTSEA